MKLSSQHYDAIAAAINDIRAIETRDGVSRESLAAIQQRLTRLAERDDLFNLEHCPPPEPGAERNNVLYRLHEDADHRFALYANAALGGVNSPVHNHTTWAVIVGVSGGEELNRMYRRTADGGVEETGRKVIKRGEGIGFMPDDLHSIQIDRPLLNFHLYGLGLEQLSRREYYKAEENRWIVFNHFVHIREARAGMTQ
jgi:predicted metal-dependent enzyme (double-stranded beta helix superfamily)